MTPSNTADLRYTVDCLEGATVLIASNSPGATFEAWDGRASHLANVERPEAVAGGVILEHLKPVTGRRGVR